MAAIYLAQTSSYCGFCKQRIPHFTEEQKEVLLRRFEFYRAQSEYYGIQARQEPKQLLAYQGEHGVFYHTTQKGRIAKIILPEVGVDNHPDIFFCHTYYENTLKKIREFEIKYITPDFPSIVDLFSSPPDKSSGIKWSIVIIIKEVQNHPAKTYRRLSTYLEEPSHPLAILLPPSRLIGNEPPILLLPPAEE